MALEPNARLGGTEAGSRVKSGSARKIAASVSEMLSTSSPDAARREPVDGSNARVPVSIS